MELLLGDKTHFKIVSLATHAKISSAVSESSPSLGASGVASLRGQIASRERPAKSPLDGPLLRDPGTGAIL